MATKRPIKFRAVHTKNPWRKASHQNIHSALESKKRGAIAAFNETNDAIDYVEEGKALYVLVWDPRTEDPAILVKPDAADSNGLIRRSVPLSIVEDWEQSGPPGPQELETYFRTEHPSGEGLHRQTSEDLEQTLTDQVRLSSMLSPEERARVLEQSDAIPKRVDVQTTAFIRNAHVIAEVLLRADGSCEDCGDPAPFVRQSDGTPYLEVHHRVPLADGGPDTVENAIALCPNCHRRCHYGVRDGA